jgi:nicotinamidase-related amidase
VSDRVRDPDDYVSVYTRDVELDPATTCLVVVDLMYATGSREHGLGKKLADEGRSAEIEYRFDRIERLVVPNTLRLLAWARAHGMRRVFLTYGSEVEDYSDLSPQMYRLCTSTRNRRGLREHELLDALAVQPTERVINKITPSAFTSSPIELILRTYGVTDLVFTGVSTNMCVEGTLRDASDMGFGCVLVEDATGADSQEYHDNTILTLQRLYASVWSTDETLARLDARVAAHAS